MREKLNLLWVDMRTESEVESVPIGIDEPVLNLVGHATHASGLFQRM